VIPHMPLPLSFCSFFLGVLFVRCASCATLFPYTTLFRSAVAVDDAPGLVESLWRRREDLLAAELTRWFDEDAADADQGWRPTATEHRFGHAEVPFDVPTTTGTRTVLLAGSIDRVDRRDGTQRVTDYKTGKAPAKDDRPRQDDPTLAGTRFQLPLYAVAAATGHDLPVSEVRYWYCTERGEFDQVSL